MLRMGFSPTNSVDPGLITDYFPIPQVSPGASIEVFIRTVETIDDRRGRSQRFQIWGIGRDEV
jgi:hypothetical protein